MEHQDRQAVKNAADSGQVKKARKKEKLDQLQHNVDMQSVLQTPAGRRVMWRLLEKCKVFSSIWEPSAKIHYNAGRQDYGFWLMSEIETASQDYMLLMMKENRKDV